jgi:hypothetical protein
VKSRSSQLLKILIEAGEFTADDMASELAATRADIDAFVLGDLPMPLPQQLCLALLVIAKSPKYQRRGHTLRAQVAAAIAFHAHETATHARPPIS